MNEQKKRRQQQQANYHNAYVYAEVSKHKTHICERVLIRTRAHSLNFNICIYMYISHTIDMSFSFCSPHAVASTRYVYHIFRCITRKKRRTQETVETTVKRYINNEKRHQQQRSYTQIQPLEHGIYVLLIRIFCFLICLSVSPP